MKCNLPGNYKTKGRQDEAVFKDAPVAHKVGAAQQINGGNLPKGAYQRRNTPYCQGRRQDRKRSNPEENSEM